MAELESSTLLPAATPLPRERPGERAGSAHTQGHEAAATGYSSHVVSSTRCCEAVRNVWPRGLIRWAASVGVGRVHDWKRHVARAVQYDVGEMYHTCAEEWTQAGSAGVR